MRPFTESDMAVLPPLQPEGWGDLAGPFGLYLKTPCCHPLAVVDKGTVIGTGCSIALGRTGWLAHIIVKTDYRNRGIGTEIVNQLMDHLLKRGCDTVSLIASDHGHPRYLAAGFRDELEYLTMEKENPAVPPVPFGTMDEKDVEAVLRMDHEFSGEDRSPFILNHTLGGLIFRRDGLPTGFWLPSLGEGLLVAPEPETGRLGSALRSRISGRFVLPSCNAEGMDFLTSRGYRETKRCWRMVYGKPLNWKPEWLFSRIGGYLG